MMILSRSLMTALLVSVMAAGSALGAEPATKLVPGRTVTIQFPEMPPTFYEQATKDHKTPMMTVFLPTNYDPQRQHPLLVFLEGQYGGAAEGPGRARDLAASKDYICVALPLFKVSLKSYLIGNEDCKLMWSLYQQMLAKLAETVPNVDPAHRIIGGFSNGAHAAAGLIDNSDGEAARYFSAFFFAEGGGHMTRYDLIKGKPLLILHGDQDPEVVLAKYRKHGEDAASAGVRVTMRVMKGVGHGFGPSEYPFVRQWMRETASAARQLTPGNTFYLQFPEMPPTYWARQSHKTDPAQMTITLPKNYTQTGKFPLFVFLRGGNGLNGGQAPVVSALSEDKDFVCACMPLFIKDLKGNGGVIQDEDGAYMWPYFRTMLEKLLQVVPNIDTEHMIMGGFSNGSHAVQGLINESDGEIARRFSAFFVIEGGPRPQRWYLLKGKPYLIVISQGRAFDGMKLYCDTAKDAGVNATLICADIGSHGIPEKAYPAMRAWLLGPAMAKASVSPGKSAAEEGAAPRQSASNDNARKGATADTLKTLAELMKSAAISEQGEGPMTFCAPTDTAFAALPKDKLDALKKDPQAARELLLNLMVKKDISPMNLPLAGKMKTLGGGILTASPVKAAASDTGLLGLALVNDAQVLQRLPVSKGRRIYSLDKVVFAEKSAASEQSTATDKPTAEPVK